MMKKYLLYASLILCFSTALSYTDKHSHYFFITVTNDSTYDFPSYYTTRSIDDITLYWYDSVSEVVERRVPWFRSTSDTLLDASFSQFMIQKRQQIFFQTIQNALGDTEGFHVLQRLQGCIVYSNDTIDTVFGYRYDGKPLLSFSVEKAAWTAEDSRVQYMVDMFNQNKTLGEQNRNVLVNTCIPHISELLSLGNCTFNRREEPIVVVTQTPISNSSSRLSCRAYGHYPKNISMMWYKNGEPVPESLLERVTLPFPDITYLTWLSVNITQNYNDVYTCSVDHKSMILPVRMHWSKSEASAEPLSKGIPKGATIAICLAVILLVVLTAFGFVSIAKSRRP